mmetsp:Transcript_27934/g.94034  ORF Transcript_27934/g.94034 Transcript_27934/m.94034 type:complete len:316 (-) Transcript_27934:3949-4896(-)
MALALRGGLDLVVQVDPALLEERAVDDSLGHGKFVFFVLRIVAQVNRLGRRLRLVAAPALAPEPLLRQRVDGDGVLRVVGQVLVQVGKGIRVARELVVDGPELVADGHAAKGVQVHHVQRRDVVRLGAEVVLPVAAAPKLVAQRLRPRIAKRDVAVGLALQVLGPELAQVAADDLVRVDVDDLGHAEGEEHVEEEDLVAPNNPLLVRLPSKPLGPLVRHVRHLEALGRSELGGVVLERRRQIVFEEPELYGAGRALADREHHNLEHPLVQSPRRQREDVDRLVAVDGLLRHLVAAPEAAEHGRGFGFAGNLPNVV